ncbi:MAG TPA: cytochrome C [Thermodesulforhabdus norvegica]|uniref:Cytochrome C n=1 Tax=Thermodesulforhabdus norvegica TaxID=39841 RepID=A0A7C1B0K7_9BACT|nr:cytochrome c3 family protein [Deltaproteobacteria bacterium]MBW2068578.1 cytochrome c3 family protein [Deltaproteobacteria bacterium]HDL90020.1 cytochrome C [Thermodesulforhabdus norvegica]
MEHNKGATSGKVVVVVAFLIGFIGALVFGWVIFPQILYSKKYQPINFSHAAHQDSSCEDCHYFREDGTYSGIPNIDNCRECHEEMMGESEAERILVEEYIQKDKPIPWLIYAWQPDNVYFSHAPHKDMDCVRCHRDVSEEEKAPPYYENRLTGYSKNTMKMVECEKCHAAHGASNACQVCHK